jgi:hypothetical protein
MPNPQPAKSERAGLEFPDMDEIGALREALREYANHTSWRCEHLPHFYLADKAAAEAIMAREDCFCGLVKTLRDLGVEVDR